MNYLNKCARFYATLGPIGYGIAPGTFASFWGLAFVIALQSLSYRYSPYLFPSVLGLIIGGALWAITYALKSFKGNPDPAEIVIDELCGILVTFYTIPLTAPILIIGFIIFRTLDITKIAGVRFFEKLHGPWGIVADDIYAGILTNIALRFLFL